MAATLNDLASVQATANTANRRRINAIGPSDFGSGPSILPDSPYVLVRKFLSWVWSSTPSNCIFDVVVMGSPAKMVRVAAGRVIAGMQRKGTVGHWLTVQDQRNSVSGPHSTVKLDSPIAAAGLSIKLPLPACRAIMRRNGSGEPSECETLLIADQRERVAVALPPLVMQAAPASRQQFTATAGDRADSITHSRSSHTGVAQGRGCLRSARPTNSTWVTHS